MKLAVFDIDGTLTRGDGVGTDCFFEAFEAVYGIRHRRRPLSLYQHQTDAALSAEVLSEAWGRAPSDAEVERHRSGYLTLFEAALERTPGLYRPVSGAVGVVRALEASSDWKVSIATGNWRAVALHKLRVAGFDFDAGRIAGAEDGRSRSMILRAAVVRAVAAYGGPVRVVYVGDRRWDLAAARAERAGFLGVGTEAAELREDGADCCVADFSDIDGFLRTLEEAVSAGRTERPD